MYVQSHLYAEFYELEKIKLRLQQNQDPPSTACRALLVFADFLYEVFTRILLNYFTDFCEIYLRGLSFKTTSHIGVSCYANYDKWVIDWVLVSTVQKTSAR